MLIYCFVDSHGRYILVSVNHSRYVSSEDYPYSLYPPYCAGAFYLMPFQIMENLIELFEQEYHRNYVWCEDVFLTGE